MKLTAEQRQKLFNYFHDEQNGVMLLDSDFNEIEHILNATQRTTEVGVEGQIYTSSEVEIILQNFGKDHKMSSRALHIKKWWKIFESNHPKTTPLPEPPKNSEDGQL